MLATDAHLFAMYLCVPLVLLLSVAEKPHLKKLIICDCIHAWVKKVIICD